MIAVGTGDFGDGPRNGMTQQYQSPLSPPKKIRDQLAINSSYSNLEFAAHTPSNTKDVGPHIETKEDQLLT